MSQNNQEHELTMDDKTLTVGAKRNGTRVAMLLEQMRGQGHAYKRGNVWWISYYGPGVDKKTGKPCQSCGEDTWLVYHGHNRSACGQYLWIERRDDIPQSLGLNLKYVQGTKLPDNYPGWFKVTTNNK